MDLLDQISKPEKFTYQDYLLWNGDGELVNGNPYAMDLLPTEPINGSQAYLFSTPIIN